MQDDQTTGAADQPDSGADTGGLSLAGPAAQATGSTDPVSDPAQEALDQEQSGQATDSAAAESTAPETPQADSTAEDSSLPPVETTPTATPPAQGDDSLDPIKKEALQKLEPLVNELDLHPEEKYRALMMTIQATDNKELVGEAYQAADKIEDNKIRAQALLSIVNEIEYFKSKESASSQ